MKKLLSLSLVLLVTFLSVTSCNNEESPNENLEMARTTFKLVDAPGDYDNVFIDVQDIVIKYNGGGDDVILGGDDASTIGEFNAGVYDLLELTGGVSALLADREIPAGDISQIRLILGEDNSVVVEGETFPLRTPSAQQSGLKIQVHQSLEEGILYEIILDFDVDRSIVPLGNGGFNLKPVIRASIAAETGTVSGDVIPASLQTLVSATNGDIEISSYTDDNGNYLLSGVPEGIYTVTLEPDVSLNLDIVTINDVQVNIGENTILDSVEF